jgi:diguanylate cyclase (GGDEF)-like protein/putative nucleotidyltransferase with HDIG domain
LRQNQELPIEMTTPQNKLMANPMLVSRKALNRFHANNGTKLQSFLYEEPVDAISIISEFYNSVKPDSSREEIYTRLNNAAISLGYSFSSFGIPDNTCSYLNFILTDLTKNKYNFNISLEDKENIIIKSFLDGSKRLSNGIGSINIRQLGQQQCVILPLVCKNESKGVFIAGSYTRNQKNDEVMNALCNYTALLIDNRELRQQVHSTCNVDNLTGLDTHKEFQEKLLNCIRIAEQTGESVSVAIFDVNRISRINKEFGHAKGDKIILKIAETVKNMIRKEDFAGRYGGDEIAIILPDTENRPACKIAQQINNALSECCIEGIGPIKVSIGVASYPKCTKDQEKLLILAEQSMLISKHNGYKNGVFSVVSAQDVDFWNAVALNTLARVVAKRHSQWGMNFEDELVRRFIKAKKLPKIPLEVVTSLAGAIDAKDTYTRGHSQAVSNYAEALARAINLPEKTVQRIKLAALLHDVGKIGIAETILRKPGALTDHEWEVMKQHPVIGAKKVLEPINSLKDLIPIVKHHHERIDGSGYPDRLKDDEIPLGAKIVAIADSFHALVSHRPYRKSLSLEKAVEILKAGAGTQWDKDLVRKFISIAPSLYTNA